MTDLSRALLVPTSRPPLRRIAAALVALPGRLAAAAFSRSDPALDWMSARDLENLGLGRTEDGRYERRS